MKRVSSIIFLCNFCPWMPTRERDRLLQWAAISPPPRPTADQLAQRLGVTYADRQRLGFTLIGAVDVDKAGRERLRRERDRKPDRQRKRQGRRG